MSYFITKQKLELNKASTITDEDISHILFSRRIKVGDAVALQDATQTRFECQIDTATKNSLTITPQKILETPPEPKLKIHIYQALINETALDIVLQKATELGATTITIFSAARSPLKLNIATFSKKLARWQKITLEAAKQSNRLLTPQIKFIKDLNSALAEINFPLVALSPRGNNSIEGNIPSSKEIGLMIGPEGGFEDSELKLLSDHTSILPVRLGPRTLRAETACIASLSILQAKFGDLS